MVWIGIELHGIVWNYIVWYGMAWYGMEGFGDEVTAILESIFSGSTRSTELRSGVE